MNRHFRLLEKARIFPAEVRPFSVCHASNICALKNGELAAAWFAGECEGSDDVSIWCARTEGGAWGKPVRVAHDADEPHWNPVLYQRADGALLLFYKMGRVIADWSTRLRVSWDLGRTFSEGRELVEGDRGGRGPVRCKVVTLSDGSLLAGTSIEKGVWTAYADRSTDGGETWSLSNPVRIDVNYDGARTGEGSDIQVSEQSFYGRGVIQPTLWESEPGQVSMLLRSSEEEIFRADSGDYGRHFSAAYPTGLPNNNSGIDVAHCGDGLLVLCMNPVRKNWGPRTPLVLMASSDNGKTWEEECVLEDAPGEYSYPSIISVGNSLYVTYTDDRKSIALQRFRRM